MDIDKIVLEFRKLYQMDYGIKTDEYQYIVRESAMIEGQLEAPTHQINRGKLTLEFDQVVEEDMGIDFLFSVLSTYFEDASYDRHYEGLLNGSLSKEKAYEYNKKIAGKRMDYLKFNSEDIESAMSILQATFVTGICVKDSGGLVVFIDNETSLDQIEGLVATLEVELFIEAKWIIGDIVDSAYPLEKQYKHLKACIRLLGHYLIQGDVVTIGQLIPYELILNCPDATKDYYLNRVFKSFKDIQLDEELTATVEMMFEQELNLTDSARALYIHRNTLLYRIEKIHKLTGYDLRKFSDGFIFKLAWMMRQTR